MRWTQAEFERLAAVGVFTEDDRIELIGGAGSPVAQRQSARERGAALNNWLRHDLLREFNCHGEPGWRADEANDFEQDFLIGSARFDRYTTLARSKD